MFRICVGVLLFSLAYGEEIFLKAGEVKSYTIKGYPNVKIGEAGNQVFHFRASPGAQILTFCEDFRMLNGNSPPCDLFELTFSDGSVEKKFCKHHDDVNFRTQGSTLTVNMKYSMGGLVSCLARSTEPPSPIKIILQPGKTETIQDPGTRTPYFDRIWEIKSPNGNEVVVDCQISMTEEKPCNRELVIIDNGIERLESCEPHGYLKISGKNKVTIRGILNEFGGGRFRCFAALQSQQEEVPPPTKEPEKPGKPSNGIIKKSFAVQDGTVQKFGNEQGAYDASFEFKFSTSPDSTFQIFCDDMVGRSQTEDPCESFEATILDGSNTYKFCRETKILNYFSKGHQLTMNIKYIGFQSLVCFARPSAAVNPTEVTLDVSDGIYIFENPEHQKPWEMKVWTFNGVPGTKISLQCFISTSSLADGTVCTRDVIAANDGEKDHIYCGSKNIVLFSKERKMKVRTQVNDYGHASYYCQAQAVTGPDPDEINNLKVDQSAEDAGETPGRVATTCQCGTRNHKQKMVHGRIFYGNHTKESEFPWMAAIRDKGNWQRCGASIITEYHILTAAHCMTNSKVRDRNDIWETVVYVGAHNRYEDASHGKTKGYDIKETYIPDKWWSWEEKYDIAVLVLKEKIVFSQFVSPVCLSPTALKVVNKPVKSLGWGRNEKGEAPTFLMTTKLFVNSRSSCGHQDAIICTVNKHSSVCHGDSGGPLAHIDPDTNRYTQIGVASYVNFPFCESSSGFSNVTYHYKYITDIIQRTMPKARVCTKAN